MLDENNYVRKWNVFIDAKGNFNSYNSDLLNHYVFSLFSCEPAKLVLMKFMLTSGAFYKTSPGVSFHSVLSSFSTP